MKINYLLDFLSPTLINSRLNLVLSALTTIIFFTGCSSAFLGTKPLATLDDFEKEYSQLASRGDPAADDADQRVSRVIKEQSNVFVLANCLQKYPSSKHVQEARNRFDVLLAKASYHQLISLSTRLSNDPLAETINGRLLAIVSTNTSTLTLQSIAEQSANTD